ncbi:MAG TPA: thiamine pyrophosphate-dependent dehydrogenase E1 component subunit alpha [Terriglobales bacterium]|jgi:TPP-dependent pyruvate/acetoin dehydrogenase alpha subunit|nr:thiamine pyrophosphate-dependent dehydrogenase E1 component subunit alpha [Terriglobales bacterium]
MTTPVAQRVDHKLLLDYYKKMLELRVFEVKVQELYRNGRLPGFVHLYVGEEAVAVGVCANLRNDDLIFSTHRGHGHALAKGVPGGVVLAELWGKVAGSSGGRGGSMHMYAPEWGFMGTNGIVGAPIPLATGGGLTAKLAKKGGVVVSFFGEGAVNSGSFHEALNLGTVWDLPVIYVCENNLYATEMAFSRATKNTSVASRAAAYGMKGVAVDGQDVMAVHDAAAEAIRIARADGGPTLIECKTYRYVGHHEGDPGTDYRTREEVQEWKQKDPVKRARKQLLDSGIEEIKLAAVDEEVEVWIEEAVKFAESSSEPLAESVTEHVY